MVIHIIDPPFKGWLKIRCTEFKGWRENNNVVQRVNKERVQRMDKRGYHKTKESELSPDLVTKGCLNIYIIISYHRVPDTRYASESEI